MWANLAHFPAIRGIYRTRRKFFKDDYKSDIVPFQRDLNQCTQQMDQQEINEIFNAAVDVAKQSGEMICRAFAVSDKTICTKTSFSDLVTETDEAVEKMIQGVIAKKYPHHKFIGEESVAAGEKCILTDDPTWLVDPVDGTMNFVHRFPYVSVSIGFAFKKEIEFGVVYNPITKHMYCAKKGQGATLNNKPIHTAETKDLSQALLIQEVGSDRDSDLVKLKMDNMYNTVLHAHGMRCLGSAALNMCQVASGAADAYFEFGIHCWDVAAALIICTEAGAIVKDTEGGPIDLMRRRVLCASTESLLNEITGKLQQMEIPRD